MPLRKRLMMALAAAALVAAMLPGVASARSDQTNLGRSVSEAKHALEEANRALKGTGIEELKLKVGRFDHIDVGQGNVGDGNVGDHNVGQGNLGDHNMGNGNVGQGNLGDHNLGSGNVGQGNHGTGNVGIGLPDGGRR